MDKKKEGNHLPFQSFLLLSTTGWAMGLVVLKVLLLSLY
jgi:hypothetical protein